METYEQKYKCAIKQAKKELEAYDSLDCDAARQIFRLFPELEESKDDRIKKEIIRYLDRKIISSNFDEDIATFKGWIDWLKKQGKQSPVEELKQEQKEQTINKACEWLKENIYNRVYKCNDGLSFPTATFLADFKKAMEDK